VAEVVKGRCRHLRHQLAIGRIAGSTNAARCRTVFYVITDPGLPAAMVGVICRMLGVPYWSTSRKFFQPDALALLARGRWPRSLVLHGPVQLAERRNVSGPGLWPSGLLAGT